MDDNTSGGPGPLPRVCYVLGKDKTYEEMVDRMTPPKVAVSGGVREERRDFLAEEEMIIGNVNRIEGARP